MGNCASDPAAVSAHKQESMSGFYSKTKKEASKKQVMDTSSINLNDFADIRSMKHLSIEVIVQHYLPAKFPLTTAITGSDIDRCRASWVVICKQQCSTDPTKSTLVLRVDNFYNRLLKRAQKFEKIFSNVRERASILTKAITFILSVNQIPNEQIRKQRYEDCGLLHRKMGISHWMFAEYITCLLETIAEVLEHRASIEVMESWIRVSSYTLQLLLEAIIRKENVLFMEYSANYSNSLGNTLKKRQEDSKASQFAAKIRSRTEASIIEDYERSRSRSEMSKTGVSSATRGNGVVSGILSTKSKTSISGWTANQQTVQSVNTLSIPEGAA